MKRLTIPPMRETALGEVMSEPPASTVTPTKWPEPKKKYPCPDCDRSFDKPQGLGAHRSRSHGYRINGKHPEVKVDHLNEAIAALFPQGVPVDRKVMNGILAFMDAYDKLAALAKKS